MNDTEVMVDVIARHILNDAIRDRDSVQILNHYMVYKAGTEEDINTCIDFLLENNFRIRYILKKLCKLSESEYPVEYLKYNMMEPFLLVLAKRKETNNIKIAIDYLSKINYDKYKLEIKSLERMIK